jgi:hypothetical protein
VGEEKKKGDASDFVLQEVRSGMNKMNVLPLFINSFMDNSQYVPPPLLV